MSWIKVVHAQMVIRRNDKLVLWDGLMCGLISNLLRLVHYIHLIFLPLDHLIILCHLTFLPLVEEYLPCTVLISIDASKVRPDTHCRRLAPSGPQRADGTHHPCPQICTVHVSTAPYSPIWLHTFVQAP